ncbi:MAG: hypothetical protein WCU88_05600 [Elusimicrobiota bacterium]|jgi:hypothetical protein
MTNKRMWKNLPLLAAAFLVFACANPPRFVKTTPILRWMHRPRMQPYIDNPIFSFDIHRSWKGPGEVHGVAHYVSKDGRAFIEAAFLNEGQKGYRPPADVRRDMAAWGAVEDSHLVSDVFVSSMPAYRVGFTTYVYDSQELLGASYEVRYTDFILVPDPEGILLLRLECPKAEYRRTRRYFEEVLKGFIIRVLKTKEEE